MSIKVILSSIELNEMKFLETHPKTMYIETLHGGHLGFYEGGLVNPNPLTWLDRTIVSLLGSLAFANSQISMKKTTKIVM